jgi:FKBP-type peptidyl-prolyl cis-trans isomerase
MQRRSATGLLLLAALLAAVPAIAQENKIIAAPATQPAPRKADPKMAYAVGLGLGQRLRETMLRDGITADHDLIVRGLVDGLNDLPSLYPDDEMMAAIAKIEATLRTRAAEKLVASDPSVRKLAEDNLARSRKFLEMNAKMTGVEILPGGVQVRVLKTGDGKVVGNSKWVIAKFEVALADGTVVDGTEDDKPRRVPTLRLPPPVLEAIRPMRVGSKWQIALPPEQAHGLAGKPPIIGPNQALMVDVELVGVE